MKVNYFLVFALRYSWWNLSNEEGIGFENKVVISRTLLQSLLKFREDSPYLPHLLIINGLAYNYIG
jgi:hypothetical protein